MQWRERIEQIYIGYQESALLLSAVKSGLLEALAGGPLTSGEAAARAELDARATDVGVLCALSTTGVVQQDGDRFALEPEVRRFLLADGENSIVSIMNHNLAMARSWMQLTETLRTGRPIRGQGRTEDELKDFILGMENISRRSSAEVSARVDLTGPARLLDLGGGPGTAAITFARAFEELECVVYDLPSVVEFADEQIAAAGLSARIETVAGDFESEDLPGGFDFVYISNIIHMLGPEATRSLFAKSRAALRPGGRILVKDFYLEDSLTEPAGAARFSVHMLVSTEAGKSYARREVLQLLAEAGFGDCEVVDVARYSQVIVAKVES